MEDDDEIYADPIETEKLVDVSALKNSYNALSVNKSNPQTKATFKPPVASKPKVNKVSTLLENKVRVFGELTSNRTSKSYSTKEFNGNVFDRNTNDVKIRTDIPITSSHLAGASTPLNTSTSKQDKTSDDAPPPLAQKKRLSSPLKEIAKPEVLEEKSVEEETSRKANFLALLQNAQKQDIARGFIKKPESSKVGKNSSLEPEKVDSDSDESLYDDAAILSENTEKRISNGTDTLAETIGEKTQLSTQKSQIEQAEEINAAETNKIGSSTPNTKDSFTIKEKKSSKTYCFCEFKASSESAPEKPKFPKKVNLKKLQPVSGPTREVTLRKRAGLADKGRLPSLPPAADMSMSVVPDGDNESDQDDYETLEDLKKKLDNRKSAEDDSPESRSDVTGPVEVYDDASEAKDAAVCEGGENDDVYEEF